MTARPALLVVDDEPRSVEVIARVLGEDFDVHTALGAAQALQVLENEWIQVVFCDQRMPERSGVDLLAEVRQRWPDVVRIIVTGYTDPEDMIGAINEAGIYQFITKPWHPDQLLLAAQSAARLYHLLREHDRLSLELRLAAPEARFAEQHERVLRNFHFDALVRTPASPLNEVCRRAAQVAAFQIPVLVLGETGTGKELLARAIHYSSLRSERPFFAVNCGAIPDELLESELFGHKKGAFTGAHVTRIGLLDQADGGTILLDEIGDVSPAFQVKLLRFLQEGEIRPIGSNEAKRVDVRVIAATHRDLAGEVKAGRFREDLYYRLAAMVLTLPPLRERRADLRVLAPRILDSLSGTHGKRVKGFTEEALACIEAYDWPGNVRELQNELTRMLVLSTGDQLGADLLSPHVLRGAAASAARTEPADLAIRESGPLKDRIERMEALILMETLVRCRWNKSRAAEELGLSRVGLRAKLDRYGIARDGAFGRSH
ncbi:sigma-54-dependent transcriptional regulator [Methylobacterium sp. 092160098-2]|uniref:sigma-54-dependent transcriptional regulator n=1 Tax=Methylobacterium sp. 092160098-2 TaxID=3025129 RepID=UPI0023819793|nr:sigma-54 dependent transcriptional regulator [Methylobacterium sp. 092160098-2]MDE4914720.1 sigma-54 dependent transcriptional regulator [Methylobacterium sp. 092160098-2]